MYRYSKISQEEIGKRFGGLDYNAVSRERKRLRERMQLDRALRESAQAIDAILHKGKDLILDGAARNRFYTGTKLETAEITKSLANKH